MVIGGGQLAKAFQNYKNNDKVVIFASGVSNSNCVEQSQFDRERNLLTTTLDNSQDKKFVYFSSCALSAEDYPKNAYYEHKMQMEKLIKKYSKKYFIFRVPQLFGCLKIHNTIINYIYNSIKNDNKFDIYSDAYRYVIEIEDVKKFVDLYLVKGSLCSSIDIANPYRYKVLNIVEIFEVLMNKKADMKIVDKQDKYTLDFSQLYNFLENNNINLDFGENYLKNRLREKISDADNL